MSKWAITNPESSVRPRTSLDILPNELLTPIAAFLVPQAPITTRFALRPAGTWECRDAGLQWRDWLAGYNELLAFAQVSQRMAAVVRPFLYHTIVIPNGRALVTLFHRLYRRPEIRPWIRDISCFVNVAGCTTVDQVQREWKRQTGGRSRRRTNPRRPSVNDCISLELLNAILLNAPNLGNLLVAFPDHELRIPPSGLDTVLPIFRDAALRYLTEREYVPSPRELPVARFFPLEGLLSRLTSLRIYCHREQFSRAVSFSRMLADYAVAVLPHLANLQTLELCCHAAGNPRSEDLTIPPLPQIEHLRLYGSNINEPRLVAFCLACVNLETLLVHFEAGSSDEDRDRLPEGKTLNDALLGLSGSLRTLELVALSEGHYLTRGTERPRKLENHRLTCIPGLTRLENLTLDYRGVFGTLGILEEDDGERLCRLLPPLLRHFTLVCEWGTAKDWKQSYLANLDMMLYGVECLCMTKSPRLSSISLAIHSWPAKSRFHRRFKREVEQARQRCVKAGIHFRTFDLFPSYQDEDDPDESEEEFDDDEGGQDEFIDVEEEEEAELEEEDEATEYYLSDPDESDPERDARRPATFDEFVQLLGEDHGYSLEELFYAYHEDRWDEYLF
ncbi:hypothetical protein QBC46DRAFT_365837 [Diplogelasinospora grovesii]|uniref:Uncharacterized protein n=1 Tax=Diplogelasinospora grovesii TaxID=303347 RepID=A0AAN6N382_9PEZI|nr:hypothetical protein QBC46DRAFT_365837 [Diplogelasinospora grovesii]